SPTPICGAATAARPSGRALSTRSSAMACTLSSKTVTGWQTLRSTGSPHRRISRSGIDHCDEIAALEQLDVGDGHSGHGAGGLRGDRRLHLHRLDRGDGVSRGDLVALLDLHGHDTGDGAAAMTAVVRIGLASGLDLALDGAVTHLQAPQLSVEGEHDRTHSAFVGAADRLDPDEQVLALRDLHRVLLTGGETVEVLGGLDHRQVT